MVSKELFVAGEMLTRHDKIWPLHPRTATRTNTCVSIATAQLSLPQRIPLIIRKRQETTAVIVTEVQIRGKNRETSPASTTPISPVK
jgi:hypothetical protein